MKLFHSMPQAKYMPMGAIHESYKFAFIPTRVYDYSDKEFCWIIFQKYKSVKKVIRFTNSDNGDNWRGWNEIEKSINN